MPQAEFRVRTFSGFRAWVIIALGLAIAGAIIAAVAVVAIGILLFVLPVLILMAVLSYAFMWLRHGKPARGSSRLPVVLDGEYRVLEEGETERPGRGNESQAR
jgi:hypothetical protein